MKITRKVTVEREMIEDIICNACGESCMTPAGASPEGLIETTVRGGYGSRVLGDGDEFTFSLCETCLARIIVGFKVPPDYADNMDPHDATFEGWKRRALSQLGESDEIQTEETKAPNG